MHYHPRQLEKLVLLQRDFRQGVLTTPLLEALGEQGEKFGLLGETRCESRGLRRTETECYRKRWKT